MESCIICNENVNNFTSCECTECCAVMHPTCMYEYAATRPYCPCCNDTTFDGFREAYELEHFNRLFPAVVWNPVVKPHIMEIRLATLKKTCREMEDHGHQLQAEQKQLKADLNFLQTQIGYLNRSGYGNIQKIFRRISCLKKYEMIDAIYEYESPMDQYVTFGAVDPGIESLAITYFGSRESMVESVTAFMGLIVNCLQKKIKDKYTELEKHKRSALEAKGQLETQETMIEELEGEQAVRNERLRAFVKACIAESAETEQPVSAKEAITKMHQ